MQDITESVLSYIARCKCGCGGIIMATVDIPEHAKEVAKEVASCIKEGYSVEHVTVGYVRTFSKEKGFGCLQEKSGLTLLAPDAAKTSAQPALF